MGVRENRERKGTEREKEKDRRQRQERMSERDECKRDPIKVNSSV